MAGLKEILNDLKEIKKQTEPDENKPYPNEYSCRLASPDKFDHFARKNCYKKHEGRCIHFIFGIKDSKSEVQSMRLPKSEWEESNAKSFCKSHKGNFEG